MSLVLGAGLSLMPGMVDAVRGPADALRLADLPPSPSALHSQTLPLPDYRQLRPLEVGPPPAEVELIVVRPGQTLGALFARYGLGAEQIERLKASGPHGKRLLKLRAGQELRLTRLPQGIAIETDLSDDETLRVQFANDIAQVDVLPRQLETRLHQAQGVIRSSLFRDGARAGLSDAVILQMVDIFGFDIDFALELQPNDRFSVVHEELFRNGEKVRDGAILAATFVNAGRRYQAVRHVAADGHVGYYTATGEALKKGFLRTPLEFSRVSSGFNLNRRHPILGLMRAHRGVDYAAPTGTPIRASGDGKISFRGVKGGYGNTIELTHAGGVSTLYAHLSRFAKQRAGERVQQGEVIGYVGKSGLATGPHLHYEFRINGVHRDPQTVPLPRAEPLRGAELAQFRQRAHAPLALLELVEERLSAAR